MSGNGLLFFITQSTGTFYSYHILIGFLFFYFFRTSNSWPELQLLEIYLPYQPAEKTIVFTPAEKTIVFTESLFCIKHYVRPYGGT